MRKITGNKKVFFMVGVMCLLGFVIFSRYVRTGIFNHFDFATTVKLQERIDSSTHLRLADVVGNVMEGSTFFAGPEFSLVFLLVLTGIVCVDVKKKKFHLRGLLIPVLFGLLVFIEIYGKTVIHHPAPPFYMIKNPTSIFPKYYINDQFSYPSGHTARAVFLGLSLYSLCIIHKSKFKGNKLIVSVSLGIIAYVILVAISRIYLGHHWFSDIIGGAFLGLAMWFFCWSMYGLLTRGPSSHIIPKQ